MADELDRNGEGGKPAGEGRTSGGSPPGAEGQAAGAEGPETLEQRVAALEEELRRKTEEVARNQDLYLRERAEAENFKKRLQRDKAEAIRFGNESLIRDILPIVDNLELAVEHANLGGNGQSVVEGVEMVLRLFRDVLERFGVTAVTAAEGTPFDANVHEAIGQEPSTSNPPNTVIRQQLKGYRLNDRLLRAARVIVAAPPAAEAGRSGSNDPRDEES